LTSRRRANVRSCSSLRFLILIPANFWSSII
jgi:hypothetical protein